MVLLYSNKKFVTIGTKKQQPYLNFLRRFREKRIAIFDDRISGNPNLIFVQHLEPPKVKAKTALDYIQGLNFLML